MARRLSDRYTVKIVKKQSVEGNQGVRPLDYPQLAFSCQPALSCLLFGLVFGLSILLSSCNGILPGIYDNAVLEEPVPVREGQIVIDATDWKKWWYLDLEDLLTGDSTLHVQERDVPMEEISEPQGKAGIYTYWYDVFKEGLKNNHFVSYYPTEQQADPDNWTLAVHRNNIRTNACGVFETSLTDINLVEAADAYANQTFTEDEWSENTVWVNQDRMLQKYIGNQGIEVNPVLSSWLQLEIKQVPPTFEHNNHVFIVRCPNGKYAALQLENYMNAEGIKCHLTINYKYPLK